MSRLTLLKPTFGFLSRGPLSRVAWTRPSWGLNHVVARACSSASEESQKNFPKGTRFVENGQAEEEDDGIPQAAKEHLRMEKTAFSLANKREYAEASDVFKKMGENGDPTAFYCSALCLMKVPSCARADVIELLTKAADMGQLDAQFDLGRWFMSPKEGEPDPAKALHYFQLAAQQGQPNAQYQLAKYYQKGQYTAKDLSLAADLYRAAIEKGHTPSMVQLGLLYFGYEKGFEQDIPQGLSLLRRAAEAGDANAMMQLGCFHFEGQFVEQDYSKAVHWYTHAGDKLDDYADYKSQLIFCYHFGKGVAKDVARAKQIWNRGNPETPYNLAVSWTTMLEESTSEEEKQEALRLIHASIDEGHASALSLLGGLYFNGKGVEQNRELAFELFEKAAEQGDAFGKYLLGVAYQHGWGTPEDPVKALFYYTRAMSAGGDIGEKAQERLRTLPGASVETFGRVGIVSFSPSDLHSSDPEQ